MLKKKSLPFMILILVMSLTAFLICRIDSIFAKAEEQSAEMFTTVTEGFTFEDEGKTVLNGFSVPQGVTGYFKVIIPDNVVKIAEGSFSDEDDSSVIANNMIAVDIPATVTTIEPEAFTGCKNLLEVCCLNSSLENNVAGSGLAEAVSFVTKASDKSLVTKTDGNGKYLFVRDGKAASTQWALIAYEGSDEDLTLPAASVCNEKCETYRIYDDAFAGKDIKSAVVPAHVTSIGERAFANCAKLEKITLNEGLTEICANAFSGTAITSVSIPKTVTAIRDSAFHGCTKLAKVSFTETKNAATIYRYAFADCTALQIVTLPDGAEIRSRAFDNCNSLLWVYLGNNTKFVGVNNAGFFPEGNNLSIIFPDKDAYTAVMGQNDKTFADNHGAAAKYTVNVNCFIGDAETPVVYERLSGQNFNYVKDSVTGFWNTETSLTGLPVQDSSYASTVWYKERELTNRLELVDVNEILRTAKEVDLYCFATVKAPADFPEEPVSWVYDGDKTYDAKDLNQVLTAMGSSVRFTDKELSALNFEVKFADEKGNAQETPEKISGNGVYSVSVKLNSKYGEWLSPAGSSATITVNTGSFTVVLIVFAVLGALAIAATVSTAVIRKKVQAKNKKKQISSQQVLEKFRAAGGETTLK